MSTIIEPTFEIAYLLVGFVLSVLVFIKGRKKIPYLILASVGFTIIASDAMTIVPRYAGFTFDQLEYAYSVIGVGSSVISIFMSCLYLAIYILYKHIYKKKTDPLIDITIYVLAAVKVIISLIPQYGFEINHNYYFFRFLSNLPFIVVGTLTAFYAFRWTKIQDNDKLFKFLEAIFIASLISFDFILAFKDNSLPLIIIAFMFALVIFGTSLPNYQTIRKQE